MTKHDYSPGQTAENGRPICGAKKKNGDPCGASPARGHVRCRRHGGATRQAKNKAHERNVRAQAETHLRSLGYQPDAENVDPAEALLRLVSDKHREVAWLRMQVDHIQAGAPDEPSPLVWGKTKHEEGINSQGPVNVDTYEADLNIHVRWLHQAEDQLARYATAALKAGVEQRQLEIKETEALAFVGALNQIFTMLNLSADQQKLIPEVVPAALRALEGRAV